MNHTPFTFDTRFDEPSARRDRDPTRPVHSEETLRATVSAAREEGRQEGIVEAADQTESLAVIVLERVAGELAAMGEREAALRRDAEQAACRLAAQFLKRFAPEYARRQGMDEIEAVLRDCLADLREEPRIVLRVAEQRVDAVQDRIEPIKARAAFPGQVILLGDGALGPADCLVEWADGGTLRDSSRVATVIDRIVERVLSTSEDNTADEQHPAETETRE